MNKRIGKVVRREARGVVVRFERPAACTGCGACARDQKTKTVFALGTAEIGDIALVQMPEGEIKRPAFLNYLIPAAGFACGLLTGYLIRPTELVTMLGAAIGMAIGSAVLRGIDKHLVNKAGGQARLLSVNDPQVMETYRKLSTCPKATAWEGIT